MKTSGLARDVVAIILGITVAAILSPSLATAQTGAPASKESAPAAAGATAQPPTEQSREAWRKSMARARLPKKGCFKASYPNTEWQEVPCMKAPSIPFQPVRRVGAPDSVGDGDGNDRAVGPAMEEESGGSGVRGRARHVATVLLVSCVLLDGQWVAERPTGRCRAC